MLFIIALILAVVFAVCCGTLLKKYAYAFYAGAAVISIAAAVLYIITRGNVTSVSFINTYIIGLFTRGALATALWCVVMWIGAIPTEFSWGKAAVKKLMPIRGELSIFAAILTLGHNIGFGRTYFIQLFTGRLQGQYLAASILTLVMLCIMLPLTVMSFPQIRKKMNARLWKRIQRAAYGFYACLYVHVMILSLPAARQGRAGYFATVLMYSIVFLGYLVCRLRKAYTVHAKKSGKQIGNVYLNSICIGIFVVLLGFVVFLAWDRSTEDVYSEVIVESEETEEITSETEADTTSSDESEKEEETEAETSTEVTEATTEDVESTETSETTTEAETVTEAAENTTESENISYAQEVEAADDSTPTAEVAATNAAVVTTQAPTNPPTTTVAATTAAVSYTYKNGTYTGTAYGYDGNITAVVTIENDVITSITASSDESDTWYFEQAQGSVISQILSQQQTSVDAVSGATYSSVGIMNAVQKALNSAKN